MGYTYMAPGTGTPPGAPPDQRPESGPIIRPIRRHVRGHIRNALLPINVEFIPNWEEENAEFGFMNELGGEDELPRLQRVNAGLLNWADALNGGIPPAQPNLFAEPPRRRPARPLFPDDAGGYRCPSPVKLEGVKRKPFFMPYDQLQEIRLRLRNTVIRVGGELVRVLDIGGENPFYLLYVGENPEDNHRRADYTEENVDLTPLSPRYALFQNGHRNANWVYRIPARGQYQQGATRFNTMIRRASDGSRIAITNESQILTAYKDKNPVVGVKEAIKKVAGTRLGFPCSDLVAVSVGTEQPYSLHYQGVKLGEFSKENFLKGSLVLPEVPPLTISMKKHLNEVGVTA